jgi:hypothetical protein
MKIPYRSVSELNVDDDINKNQTDIHEKTKSKSPYIRNSLLKNKNKTLMHLAREREKRTTKRYEQVEKEKETKEIELQSSLKKVIEEKETEKNKMEETLKDIELQQQKFDNENKKLKQLREKEKIDNELKLDKFKKLEDDFNKKLDRKKRNTKRRK